MKHHNTTETVHETADREGNPRCVRCGACCDRPGYVYVTAKEVERIAAYLELSVDEFTQRYTRLSDNRARLSLIDSRTGGCAFLDPSHQCRIQPVKPRQCIDFPWRWRYDGYEEFCAVGQALDGDTEKNPKM